MPTEHALLSASSSDRWLHCTPAPRLEETLPDNAGTYAAEGTLAHAIAELKLRNKFTPADENTFISQMDELKKGELYQSEMQGYTDAYVNFVTKKAMAYEGTPHVTIEARLDFSNVVPDGFGTGDCILVGNNRMDVIDFKYGKGKAVFAEDNSQMRLYALGAIQLYASAYKVEQIGMSIFQPRIDNISETEVPAEELIYWGREVVKPRAALAFKGEGEFAPGDWCGFCRAKATCRARMKSCTAVEDFGFVEPVCLADSELNDVLRRAKQIKAWVSDVEAYALQTILSGKTIPGWKVVEGRSIRKFKDTDAALKTLVLEGYPEASLYERSPKSLAALEKMLGKKLFEQSVGAYVVKPPGKPTLARDSDARPAYNSAAVDFEGLANDQHTTDIDN